MLSKVSKNVVKSILLLSLLLFPYFSYAQDINTGNNNLIEKTVSAISKIGDWFGSMYDLFLQVSSFLISVFGFIWYGLKTLFIGVGKLIGYITGIAEWGEVVYSLGYVGQFIGPVGVMFIASVMLLAIIRILYSFIHKLIKNPHYKPRGSKKDINKVVDDLPGV